MSPETVPDNNYRQDAVASMLLPGENIVAIAAISPGIYWKGIAVMVVALVALVLYGFWLALYCAVIGAGLLLLAYSTKKYLVLAATDHRVIIQAGLLTQEVVQLRYHQIESVDILYTLPGGLFGYSSLILTGTGTTQWMIPFVRNAEVFRDALMQKLLEREEPLVHQAA